MQEDAGRRAREPRGRRDGQAVVAVAGADQGRQGARAIRRIEQAGQVPPRGAGQRAQAGIGPAEGLEAAQHAAALVLGQQLRDPAAACASSGRSSRGVGA